MTTLRLPDYRMRDIFVATREIHRRRLSTLAEDFGVGGCVKVVLPS